MKMQLKTFGVGILLILGLNVIFTLPYLAVGILHNAGVLIQLWADNAINLACAFGRILAMIFSGMLLCKWRNKWETFPDSRYDRSSADFCQQYLAPIIGLFVLACLLWNPWNDLVWKIMFFFTSGVSSLQVREDGSMFILPFHWFIENFLTAPMIEFALIGFVAGYFGRKSKLRPKAAMKSSVNAAM